MRILVTGSQGKLGKVLVGVLSREHEIVTLDLKAASTPQSFAVDISDFESLCQVFSQAGRLDFVIHLAGAPDVRDSWEKILQNNIIGTRNIYECAKIYGVRRVIFASSNHVTGRYERDAGILKRWWRFPKMIKVTDPIRPDSDYGVSKTFGEAIAREYFELYDIESICLRIGSVIDDDNPTRDGRHLRTWLSHRDFIQLVQRSLRTNVKFGIYYGVSNNTGRFWDIANARRDLDYRPQDNAYFVKKRLNQK